MDDEDAWQPAYESLGEKDLIIPTKSAEKLMDHLGIVTGTCHYFGLVETTKNPCHSETNLTLTVDNRALQTTHCSGTQDVFA